MPTFNSVTLPKAIGELFRLNDHTVKYSVEINGAEVDIIAATSVANPFSPTIYVEATIEYVNNDKYAKDLTKFVMFREVDQRCVCLLVSSSGFSGPVRERAEASGILTLTYDELFSKFEKISPYADATLLNENNLKFRDTMNNLILKTPTENRLLLNGLTHGRYPRVRVKTGSLY